MKTKTALNKPVSFIIILGFILGFIPGFNAIAVGQSATSADRYSGIYKNVWHYKRDVLSNTSYVKIVFLNDSTCLYISSNKPNDIQFNSTGPNNASYIGRKMLYKGQPKWFIIRDDANIGYRIAADEFTDTSGRMDFNQAVNFDWTKGGNDMVTEPSKNPYEIYELQFYQDSFYVSAFRTFQPDNGDLGMHYKIKRAVINNADQGHNQTFESAKTIEQACALHPAGMQIACANCFFPAKVKTEADSRYIPIRENIPGNLMADHFETGENVLIQKGTYMNYVFAVSVDDDHHITKYGWILRNKLAPKVSTVP